MSSSAPDPASPPVEQPPVVIKKYANRRLYNTETSSYITLDHLAQLTRAGRDFQVFDAKTGEDITRTVLTQIIMEAEASGQTMLPVPFLRQLIAMYGDQMQSMVPHYLEASMAAFSKNQAQFRNTMAELGGAAMKPWETLAKQNMAMLEAAASLMTGRTGKPRSAPSGEELGEIKAQMAALQAKLEKLGG